MALLLAANLLASRRHAATSSGFCRHSLRIHDEGVAPRWTRVKKQSLPRNSQDWSRHGANLH